LNIETRLRNVTERLAHVETDAFVEDCIGTIGADPIA
jgi:hypothetical protein